MVRTCEWEGGCDWKLTCGRERTVDEGDCRTMKVRGLIVLKSRMRRNGQVEEGKPVA